MLLQQAAQLARAIDVARKPSPSMGDAAWAIHKERQYRMRKQQSMGSPAGTPQASSGRQSSLPSDLTQDVQVIL